MKIRLGKTATSRTRKKPARRGGKVTEDTRRQTTPQDGFTGYLLRKGYSSTTAEGYVADVKRFLTWCEQENTAIDNAGYNDITAYLHRLGNIAQHTKWCYVRGIKQYFNFLIQQGERADNPAAFIQLKGGKRKSLHDILNRQELDSLYYRYTLPDAATDKDRNQNWFKARLLAQQRNKVILGLLLFQSVDTRDLQLLTVSDVKLREGKIYIPGTRKSNERELKLEALQIMDLMEYLLKTRAELLQLTGKETEQLFISTGSSDKVHSVVKFLIERLHAIYPKVASLQQLRASVIVYWLKLYNLREVQYMAGHRYVSSTEAFLVNEMDGMIEDIEKYHPIA